MQVITCPVCRDANAMPLFYAGEHRMYRCGACALAFVFPVPDDAYLAAFYSDFHRDIEQGGGYELLEDRMSADFPRKVAMIRAQLAGVSDARILDVGCGKGYFVKACVDGGLNAEGIDLSDVAVEHANRVLGVRARCGRIESLSHDLKYDAVTLWATIEHLNRPLETLAAIRGVLKPGGLLFLDTGIGHDWLDRCLPGFVQWYDPPQHLFVFSAKAMNVAIASTGFELLQLDPCFERTPLRRLARQVRGAGFAMAVRAASQMTRVLGGGPFAYTRFPLGNLMSVVAKAQA